MQTDMTCSSLLQSERLYTYVVSGYNLSIGMIKKITNAPTLPVSQLIYHYISSENLLIEKRREDFEYDGYPYRYYIDLFEAMKIMKSAKVRRLLEKLYSPERNNKSPADKATHEFLELTGIARVIIAEVNPEIYRKLVKALDDGGALRTSSENSRLPSIPRDTVLLNFFSSFIAPKFISLPMINEGVKTLVTSGIALMSPALAEAIKYIDTLNPIKFLFPDGDTTSYLHRLRREEMMAHHFREQIRRSKNLPQKLSSYPTSHHKYGDAVHQWVSSSGATPDAPLLGVLAGTALSQHVQSTRAGIAGLGAMIVAGSYIVYHYLPAFSQSEKKNKTQNTHFDLPLSVPKHDVSFGEMPRSLSLTHSVAINSTCYNTTTKIRELLHSGQTGFRLVEEFYHYIFDNHSDHITKHTEKLLKKFNIENFNCNDRDEINAFLTYIFSALLTPVGRKNVTNLNKLIMLSVRRVNFIWRKSNEIENNITINEALKRLRIYIYKDLASLLGTVDLTKLKGLENYILTQAAPDFIQFENHGLGNQNVISKLSHYYWTYMGKEYPANKFIRHDDFDDALILGEMIAYYLIRFRNYHDIFESINARENFANYTKHVNPDFFAYHEKDVQLERLDFITFDDIIEDQYQALGVNIYKKINPNAYSLWLHLSPERHKELPYLRKCRNMRDVIRSFEDGPKILKEFIPNLVPQSLRRHLSEESSAFVLRAHPTRSELKKLYEDLSRERDKEHIELYEDIIRKALEIITPHERDFIYHPDTEISLVVSENRRVQYFKYIIMPKSYRINTKVAEKVFYNPRPYCEKGVFFSAINKGTKEKRFYTLNIEASRARMQLPISRLEIDNASEIENLESAVLDGHYTFHDGRSFWDPCEKVEEFRNPLSLNPKKTEAYFSEKLHYLDTKWCAFTRHPKYIIAFFTEKKLGPAATAIPLIHKAAVDNRRAFLSMQKERIHTASETESEQDERKGLFRNFLEKLPTFTCFELIYDLVIKQEDSTYTSRSENVLQGGICAVDVLVPIGLAKAAKTLGHSAKKLLINKLKKKHQIALLEKKIQLAHTLPQTSQQRFPQEIDKAISLLEADLIRLDSDIKIAKKKISNIIIDMLGTPSKIEYPIVNIKDSETALSTIFFWILVQSKKQFKQIQSEMKILRFQPWEAPEGNSMKEIENYALPLPPKEDIPCYSDQSRPGNITANIFDIRLNDPDLYKDLFFSALKSFDVQDIISVAKDGGWKISSNYDQMAMYCFRAFTMPVRIYVGRILELEAFYKLNPANREVSADVFYRYFKDNLNKNGRIPQLILTSEQNLLINQSIKVINHTFKSNIQAFEVNYIYMLKHLMMDIKPGLLFKLTGNGKQKVIAERIIQQDINYNLYRFTFYSTRSSAQEKFHIEVIRHLSEFVTQAINEKPSAITLFSPSLKSFNQRCNEYKQLHHDDPVPTPAEFIRTEFQMERKITEIYEKYARVEYTAKILADYPVEDWASFSAQEEWLAAIQEYLSPEMRYQDLRPFLTDVTKRVTAEWLNELHNITSAETAEVVTDGDVNPEFIAIVKRAFIHCGSNHQRLLFCQYYEADEGRWFTFLTNDFITETHRRSRRQVYSDHPFFSLPVIKYQNLNASLISPLQRSPSELIPIKNSRYNDALNLIVKSFSVFSSYPFHQRLYSNLLSNAETKVLIQDDVISMINAIINDDGTLVHYQIKVLLSYFPSETIVDNEGLLLLLADIFQLANPTSQNLYQHAFNQIQIIVNYPWVTLAHLQDKQFIAQQSAELIRSYQMLHPENKGMILTAISRYFKAAIHHQLAFSSALIGVDTDITSTTLTDEPAQQLCFGAIIAHHLKLKSPSHSELLRLYFTAMQDAGFIPMAALRQMALFTLSGTHYVDSALQYLASRMEQMAETQKYSLACVNDCQEMAVSLNDLIFETATYEQHHKLLTLSITAMKHLFKLFSFALPEKKEKRLRQARNRGELRFTWYITEGKSTTVAGIGLDILNQDDGVLFPFGVPLPVAGICRQTPSSRANDILTRVCFGDEVKASIPFSLNAIIPDLPASRYNETVITTLINSLEAELREQLHQLTLASNAMDFVARKNRTEIWMKRNLPFFASGVGFAEQEQSERIVWLNTSPEVKQWRSLNHTRPENMSSIDYAEKMITRVMGKFTDLPVVATALRTRNQLNSSISYQELPLAGFMGIWWDPMTYACYLGFSKANERSLYANLVDNRNNLYFLADNSTHARIWQSLRFTNELLDDYNALRRGELSLATFFDYNIPVTWKGSIDDTGEKWNLLSSDAASNLIGEGVMYPVSYLQRENGQHLSPLKRTPYVWQHRSGNFVFIFSESHYQKVNYRFVDSQGQLQTLYNDITDWPQEFQVTSGIATEKLFSDGIKKFIALEQGKNTPDFTPLLNETELRQIRLAILNDQITRREYIRNPGNNTADIPFRYDVNPEGLLELELELRRYGRHLFTELQIHLNKSVELTHSIWNVFSWRDDNLYDEKVCNNTMAALESKLAVFNALEDLLDNDPALSLFKKHQLYIWLKESIDILSRSISAISWLKPQLDKNKIAKEHTPRLYENCIALNNFFSFYDEQPYVTPDLFMDEWQYRIYEHWSTLDHPAWEQALVQLRFMAIAMPDDIFAIKNFINLSQNTWKKIKIQTYNSMIYRSINNIRNYWQQSLHSDQFVLIRPQTSTLQKLLSGAKRKHQIKLILTARVGSIAGKGKYPPLFLTPDQSEDLLLVDPGPTRNTTAIVGLAGVNSEPRTIRDFIAWSRNRLAGSIFMNELSGTGFFLRLQKRISQVISMESSDWNDEERQFYTSAATYQFLQASIVNSMDKISHLAFLSMLFSSDILVTRLIMPDPEMIFGLLCHHFIIQHPERAHEDISVAWFLFRETFDIVAKGSSTQPPYLIGV